MSLFSLRDDRGPAAAVEIAPHRVAAVRVEWRSGRRSIVAQAVEALPDGLIVPSLTAVNIANRAGVTRALDRVLQAIDRPKRIGLVIPDPSAKMSLIKFQQVPSKPAELEQLIRWQMKKASPFPIEEAQVTYAAASETPEGREFLVTAARRNIVTEYEDVCAESGAYAGLIDVSTSCVINMVLAIGGDAAGDRLLVNVARDWVSLAVLRGGNVVLLRSRSAAGDETLADLVHQTAMYYEDRLQGAGFSQVLLCGALSSDVNDGLEALQRTLAQRLQTSVSAVDPTRAATFADRGEGQAAQMDALTPALGLLVRSQGAAA